MSTSYTFDVALDTANGQVNADIMAEELMGAGLSSGGTFEGVTVEGGVGIAGGVIVGGTMVITWQNALSSSDETAQTALVNAHQGAAFGDTVLRAEDETLSSTTSDTLQSKLALTAEPLPAGKYLLTAYAEIRMSAVVSGSFVRGVVDLDSVEVAEDNWALDVWHAFAAEGIAVFLAGASPTLSILYERTGPMATVEIRRARLSISQQMG